MQASFVQFRPRLPRHIDITSREMEILEMISYGHSTEEIANELFVSPETIKSHRRSLLTKLKARNTAQLIRIAFEQNHLKLS
jgi:DNA-binding CsgD family transcriptional regulator